MTSFYILIKIAHNPASGDSLTIGLVFKDALGFRYRFSRSKKDIARNLLNDKGSIIDYVESQIAQNLSAVNEGLSGNISDAQSNKQYLPENYFSYLNRYCNGILQFSEPSMVFEQVDNEKFDKLYHLLVDGADKETIDIAKASYTKDAGFYRRIEHELIYRVQERVHTRQKIDSKMIPSIVTPFELDCIGKNGAIIGAKSIAFTLKKKSIAAHLNSYMNVIFHLGSRYPNVAHKFFLISDEPSDLKSEEHQIWESLLNEDQISLINSEECGKIATLIEERNAGRFL